MNKSEIIEATKAEDMAVLADPKKVRPPLKKVSEEAVTVSNVPEDFEAKKPMYETPKAEDKPKAKKKAKGETEAN